MNIIIIEDEIKTAKALANLITKVHPEAKIVATMQSIEKAVAYFSEHCQPDLIFMDIQLSDGLCFEIFKKHAITAPVIFCTAYSEYTLEAFKANGIDYVLKPFSIDSVSAAINKAIRLKNFFQVQQNATSQLELILQKINNGGKKGFLVFKNNKYVTIKTENVAYFFIKNETTFLMTLQEESYQLKTSLEELVKLLPENQFFRINRQYLINYSVVKEVEHYFLRKLYLRLTVATQDKLIIGKDKAVLFLSWLENR